MGYIKLFNNTATYQDYINGEPLLPNVSLVEEDESVFYNPFVDYSKEYMYVEALEDEMTVSFTKTGSLYYSLDKQEWNELTGETPAINSGEKVYFKGDLVPVSYSGIGTFVINKQCNVAGNVMSLLFGDDFVGKTDLTGYNYVFWYLFKNCTTIQSAENLILPATTLAVDCYGYMFQNCSSLTTPPKLPATILAYNCYQYMFQNCSSLVNAPELPATTLDNYCYSNMFNGCSSLTTAPELPATTLAYYCYYSMFYNCSSLVNAPELPVTTLADRCYHFMFYGCTSLVTAPELPATTLTDYCYDSMFSGCTNLTTAPELPATTLAPSCYDRMFYNCSSLVNAPELPATTLADYCYASMFYGCTSLTIVPELPATTLAYFCYGNMFQDCTNLTTAPELPATTLAYDCYYLMFSDCTKLQVLTKSEFIKFNDINSGFNGTLKDCYMPKNQNVIVNLSDSDEVIFNYSDGIYSALREETILTDILSQEDISTLTPEYDLVVTVYDNYPDPHIVNTPNICEHITWAAGQSLEEFAENFNFDYNNTSISILYTSRKGGDYYYYYD